MKKKVRYTINCGRMVRDKVEAKRILTSIYPNHKLIEELNCLHIDFDFDEDEDMYETEEGVWDNLRKHFGKLFVVGMQADSQKAKDVPQAVGDVNKV